MLRHCDNINVCKPWQYETSALFLFYCFSELNIQKTIGNQRTRMNKAASDFSLVKRITESSKRKDKALKTRKETQRAESKNYIAQKQNQSTYRKCSRLSWHTKFKISIKGNP